MLPMEPASKIITELGGPAAVSLYVGVHRTRVSNWKRSIASGGTGGRIPAKHIPKLLALAAEKRVSLTIEDLFGPVPPRARAARAPAPAREG